MRAILIVLGFFVSTSAFANERQFVCEFTQEVLVAGAATTNPKPQVKAINEKYTFIFNGNKSSYINLRSGVKVPLNAVMDSQKVIFIESNITNNHFVVTVFLDRPNTKKSPAIMSQQSLGEGVSVNDPYQRYGSCI